MPSQRLDKCSLSCLLWCACYLWCPFGSACLRICCLSSVIKVIFGLRQSSVDAHMQDCQILAKMHVMPFMAFIVMRLYLFGALLTYIGRCAYAITSAGGRFFQSNWKSIVALDLVYAFMHWFTVGFSKTLFDGHFALSHCWLVILFDWAVLYGCRLRALWFLWIAFMYVEWGDASYRIRHLCNHLWGLLDLVNPHRCEWTSKAPKGGLGIGVIHWQTLPELYVWMCRGQWTMIICNLLLLLLCFIDWPMHDIFQQITVVRH